MDKNYNSLRVFKNPMLEALTHVHPIIPLLLWGPVSIWFIWRSFMIDSLSFSNFALFFLAGLLLWTWIEYVLHRYVFHYPAKSALGKRAVFLFHGLHHDDPKDPTRLVMPPVPALIYITLFYLLFDFLFGRILSVNAFFSGFLIGYLAYDYIHYSIHHFKPKSAVGRYLRRHHLQHHGSTHHSQFGVSSPLWDYVYSTMRESQQELKKSRS